MPPESAKYLRDALDAAILIGRFVSGKTMDEYRADPMLRSAVQWNFAVIGEALSQLHKTDPATVERIAEWNRIIGFRNQLIHGYGVIRDTITWDIIELNHPVLMRELESLLEEPC
jgi:uncharacterized protein with HEPN domain